MNIHELNNKDKKKKNTTSYMNMNDIVERKKETIPSINSNTEYHDTTTIEIHSNNKDENNFSIISEQETTTKIPIEIQITPEENQEELEYKVIESIERIIKTDLYELENIKFKLEVLNEIKNQEFETTEIERLKEELEYIIKKFEEVKNKYKNLEINSNTELQIDENEIYNLVNEYKERVTSEKSENLISEVNKQIKQIEEYVSVIDILIHVGNEKDNLETELDEKLEELQIRDDEFDKLQLEYTNIQTMNDEIEAFTKEQDKIIKELQYKIEHTETITKSIEIQTEMVTNFSKIINAIIMFEAAKKIPATPAGMIIKTNLILGAISSMSQLIEIKETKKEVINVSYTDYVIDIENNISSVHSMVNYIDKAQKNIEKISYTFKKECEEYRDSIPEYNTFLKKIEYMNKTLTEQKDIANKHKDEFDKVLEKNNDKVKKLEALKAA